MGNDDSSNQRRNYRVLAIQSGGKIEDMVALLAGKIKSITSTHFGEPKNIEAPDLNESKKPERFSFPNHTKSGRKI
ncbi:MAG: hypothetical protein NZM26_02935 [Patescibacteria group bacterium]|nr:hypothetical protein [Patescibacteria group bacterium]